MKWQNDPYGDLKDQLYAVLCEELWEEHAKRITIKELFDAIDELVNKLIPEDK